MPQTDLTFKKRLALTWVPRIFKWYFLLLGLTCRQVWKGKEQIEALKAKKQNWIYSLWHQNVSATNYVLRNQGFVGLTSPSYEGEIAARILYLFHNDAVRGSSSKGGAKALLGLIKKIKKGQSGLLTPDGPRGPKYELKPGVIILAQKTGCPLVPFHLAFSRPRIFKKSWDQHQLPRFFSRIFVELGEPFFVPKTMNKEEFSQVRQQFENKMNENVKACEARAKGNNHEI